MIQGLCFVPALAVIEDDQGFHRTQIADASNVAASTAKEGYSVDGTHSRQPSVITDAVGEFLNGQSNVKHPTNKDMGNSDHGPDKL